MGISVSTDSLLTPISSLSLVGENAIIYRTDYSRVFSIEGYDLADVIDVQAPIFKAEDGIEVLSFDGTLEVHSSDLADLTLTLSKEMQEAAIAFAPGAWGWSLNFIFLGGDSFWMFSGRVSVRRAGNL